MSCQVPRNSKTFAILWMYQLIGSTDKIFYNGVASLLMLAKRHRSLPVDTEEAVYLTTLALVCRRGEGDKGFSVVDADGKREHKQKRLVLSCNLREANREFKECHPDRKISFTKFSQLHPKECVLADHWYTFYVRLHSSSKCAIDDGRQWELEALSRGQLKHYRHCLALMQCNPPNFDCYLGS